ncbi:hypothetical protein SAMN04487897_11653 [Paenibacillus sp. yr247]|nr:hypothetical protein SAMN04487897_11653 [Paenibacillus sp. yr247]
MIREEKRREEIMKKMRFCCITAMESLEKGWLKGIRCTTYNGIDGKGLLDRLGGHSIARNAMEYSICGQYLELYCT